MIALSVDAVSKWYGYHRAVDRLSLSATSGEVVGLLGNNGAGKTTTLRMIAGLIEPDGGTIQLTAQPGGARLRRAELGVVFCENWTPEPALSVTSYLRYFGRIYGLGTHTLDIRIDALLRLLRLDQEAARPIGHLSGGNRRKVELARALLPHPRVLLLDEPTRELDLATKKALWDLLRDQARRSGLLVVVASHDPHEVATLCSKVVVMREGQATWTGDARQVAADGGSAEGVLRRLGA